MTGMKYVMIKSEGHLVPILFDTLLPHSMFQRHKILSAGFVGIYASDVDLIVSVWGKSDSLDIQSDSNDADIIKESLQRNY